MDSREATFGRLATCRKATAILLTLASFSMVTGCVSVDALFGSVSEDLALVTSSATQGFLAGFFNSLLAM